MRNRLFCILALAGALSTTSVWAQESTPLVAGVFATVDGSTIVAETFDRAAREAFRRRFYHGTPPESEVNAMLKDVGQSLIDSVLIDKAAVGRGVMADATAVAERVARVEQQNAANPAWVAQRAALLPELVAQLERNTRRAKLEAQVRAFSPSEQEVGEFYKNNPDLFTEPTRNRVSMILLGVDPASASPVWEAAHNKAGEIKAQLGAGEDFATLAKALSTDSSAPQGGDLGYLHQGMLGERAEAEIEKLMPGAISDPIQVLEGVAIFRLDERLPAKLQPFEAVAARAKGLLVKQAAENQWANFLAGLNSKAKIVIDPAFQKIMLPETAESQK